MGSLSSRAALSLSVGPRAKLEGTGCGNRLGQVCRLEVSPLHAGALEKGNVTELIGRADGVLALWGQEANSALLPFPD